MRRANRRTRPCLPARSFCLEVLTLPELHPLLSLPDATLRALPARLRSIGLGRAFLSPTSALLRGIHPILRPAARAFHLRQSHEPAALAARLLVFEDAITREEAGRALGELLTPLLEAGLLSVTKGAVDGAGDPESGDRVSCRFVVSLVDDLLLFSDARSHGEGAVPPPGDETIALLSAAIPDNRVGRALDLGCGSGACALRMALRAERVIATDIHARALDFTRLNARMNGIGNVEAREGSLFDPVANETFDLVVSQPPFVPRPEGAAASPFVDGGRRGDEIALALIGGIAPHIGDHGRAVLLVDWPSAKEPVAERVRKALGANALDLLILEAPRVGADEHITEYSASVQGTLGEAFVADALMRRAHFEREGISAIVPSIVVIQRSAGAARPGFTDAIAITSQARGKVTAARIDKLFAAREVGAAPKRLLASKLRVPAGTTFSEEQKGPGMDKPSSLSARFADEALIHPVPLTPELLAAVTLIHESDSVQAGLARYAEAFEVTPEEAFQFLPRIAQSLRQGLLEIG